MMENKKGEGEDITQWNFVLSYNDTRKLLVVYNNFFTSEKFTMEILIECQKPIAL